VKENRVSAPTIRRISFWAILPLKNIDVVLPYQALLDSTQAASTLLLGILYPYPKHTHIAAKGMPTLCQGYAKGMPRVCEKLLSL